MGVLYCNRSPKWNPNRSLGIGPVTGLSKKPNGFCSPRISVMVWFGWKPKSKQVTEQYRAFIKLYHVYIHSFTLIHAKENSLFVSCTREPTNPNSQKKILSIINYHHSKAQTGLYKSVSFSIFFFFIQAFQNPVTGIVSLWLLSVSFFDSLVN